MNFLQSEFEPKYYRGEESYFNDTNLSGIEQLFWQCEFDAINTIGINSAFESGVDILTRGHDDGGNPLPECLYNKKYALIDRIFAAFIYYYRANSSFSLTDDDMKKYLEK